jgi:hypothetical protein
MITDQLCQSCTADSNFDRFIHRDLKERGWMGEGESRDEGPCRNRIPSNSVNFPWKHIMKKIRQMFLKNFKEFHGIFHNFHGIPWKIQ